MSEKDKTISEVYYDQAGFGSIATTYKDAKKKGASITMQDVKEWFQENVERKKQLSGYNSFIAPDINFEYQLDLFFISKNDLDNQKYRIGLLLIDVFSRKAAVVPIASKQPADITAGIMVSRKYPPVRVGDEVKTYRKKGISEKERTSNWSSVKYKVSRVEKKLGQDYYSVEGMNRPYLRSEILRV